MTYEIYITFEKYLCIVIYLMDCKSLLVSLYEVSPLTFNDDSIYEHDNHIQIGFKNLKLKAM